MVIDFSAADFRETPVLVLRNLDGTPLQTLGFAHNLSAELCYNEISTVTFDVPEFVNGVRVPHYDDIIGTRIVDMVGWGQFVLADPSEEKDGIKTVKSCKAYSLEYELTYKQMSLEENTYNFWNPVAPDETIIGIILSYLPSWSVGSIDSSLIGKYRTFSENNVNIYNFIKSTVQDKYSCIFDFDTYNRRINVRATSSGAITNPVYISLENLAKKITLEEDTENIFTVLDVNGAEGVTIRSVNPMGTNKIYDLSYFMNTGHFSQEMIDKWEEWKEAYENAQVPYYNLTVERMLKTMEILNLQNEIDDTLGTELAVLKNQQAVKAEYLASIQKGTSDYQTVSSDLSLIGYQISNKESQIAMVRSELDQRNAEKDELTEALVEINESVAFEAFFTDEELLILDRYFKESAIEDSSFVYETAETYVDDDVSGMISSRSLSISDAVITEAEGYNDRSVYTVRGGSLSLSGTNGITSELISASVERKTDGSFIFTGYLGSGTVGDMSYMSGCVSLAGTCGTITSSDDEMSFTVSSAHLYFTKSTTAYQEHTVEWDLYNYGRECLAKLCYPSYTFNVTSANFFSLDEFSTFASAVELGQQIYLDTDGSVLTPILVKVGIDFENPASLSLQFGDRYNLSDSSFSLVDLLEKSVSMGKTVDTSRFGYNAFIDSGASTAVKDYMTAALDASKQAILSGSDIAVSFDGSGLHARKRNSTGTGYEPEELAIINNNIVFTKDNWATAEMAIGRFHDKNFNQECWGIVAPNIVGTLLAGENLVIESTKQDGGVSVFKVDADGAALHNAKFDIVKGTSHIMMDPSLGFAIGTYPVTNTSGTAWNTNNTKFWVDTSGNVHLKGVLEGVTGTFSGEITGGSISIGDNFFVTSDGSLTANNGTFKGTVYGATYKDSAGNNMMSDGKFDSDYLNLKGLTVTNSSNQTTFAIDSGGNVTVNGNITLGSGSTISWNNVTNKPTDLVYEDDLSDVATSGSYNDLRNKPDIPELPSYITSTAITETTIISPHIKGNDVTIAPNDGYASNYVGGLTIEGKYGNSLYDILHVYYHDSGDYGPVAAFENDWPIRFYDDVMFTGDVDFSEATVTGLSSATAVFG